MDEIKSSENSDYDIIVKETDKANYISMEFENLEKEELKVKKKCAKSENKLNLLKSNLEKFEESQNMLNIKLNRLLNLMKD